MLHRLMRESVDKDALGAKKCECIGARLFCVAERENCSLSSARSPARELLGPIARERRLGSVPADKAWLSEHGISFYPTPCK